MDPEQVAQLRVAIGRVARRLRQTATGITPSQLSVLFTVERHGPLTPGDLAEREGVSGPTVSRILSVLEADGLVRRRPGEGDRRTASVTVLPLGRRTLSTVRRRRDAWLARRVALLDAEDAALLAAAVPVLEKLLEGADAPSARAKATAG